MKEYVFPHCSLKEEEIRGIKGISRLFAYPKIPHYENDGKVVILDSGAFGLSLQGRKIGLSHMRKLDKHYRENSRDNTLCIAPDEFLNPVNSMMNIRKWYQEGFYPDITAVLQCENMKKVDYISLKYQAKYYSNFTETICFSNNGLTGQMAKDFKLGRFFKYLKKELKYKWIHILGAGWSLEDIRNWQEIDYYDSLDSIAYYQTKDIKEFGSLDPLVNIKTIKGVIENV